MKFATVVFLLSLSSSMLLARQSPTNGSPSSAEPPCPSQTGPYYLDKDSTWKPLERVRLSGERSGGAIPLVKGSKMKVRYRGAAASITVGSMPVFCYTGPTEDSQDIVLASLEVKGDYRELQVASGRVFGGANVGVSDKKLFPIEITKTSTGLRLSTKEPLPSGQYIILPAGGTSGYDFGVSDSEQANPGKD